MERVEKRITARQITAETDLAALEQELRAMGADATLSDGTLWLFTEGWDGVVEPGHIIVHEGGGVWLVFGEEEFRERYDFPKAA